MKEKRFFLTPILILILLTGCRTKKNSSGINNTSFYSVTAQAETKPVPRNLNDDAADDPAIWINYSMPDSSRIIGTDKKGGLAVYDMSGKEIFYYNSGEVNNVDLRYKFPTEYDTIDILAVSNRSGQSVDLYRIMNNGSLQAVHKQPLRSGMTSEIYGLCMYHNIADGKYYVFANSKSGEIEQWELFADKDKLDGKVVHRLKLKTQVEGMVADDENGFLYVGEEDAGIWKFEAAPSSGSQGILLNQSSERDNSSIDFDIEGLAIYYLPDSSGYLLASSQGNNSFAVFERKVPNKYIASFKIVSGYNADGSEDTDGIDVTSTPMGSAYPEGLLVVQDGHNEDCGVPTPQNFKLVRWDSVARKFNPSLNY